MSNLSELLPSGGGQNVVSLTASGAVSSGKPVILNTNGTVTEVAGSSSSASKGSATTFDSGDRELNDVRSIAYDSTNNRVVIAYRDSDNSGYGTAVVGTVSGDTISFGTPVVYESADSLYNAPVFDENAGKVVIFYRDQGNSERGTAIVGTVSGTSISFGSPTVFNSGGASNFNSPVYDPDTQKVVNFYKDEPNSSYGTAIVGTVSGTSISFGSEVVFETADSEFISATYDTTANKMVVAYRDNGNSLYGTAIVGTVSGTSISFGSAAVFATSDSRNISIVYDASADRVVVFFSDSGDSNKGKAVVGTVSGTSISFGSLVTFSTADFSNQQSGAYFAAGSKVVVSYRADGTLTYQSATVSGTSLTFDGAVTLDISSPNDPSIIYDSTEEKIVLCAEQSSSSGQCQVFSPAYSVTNLTSTNFIGLASAAISDTASGNINVFGGISTAHSGLNIGSDYYVQNDGVIAASGSIPFSISSATFTQNFSVSSQDSSPRGIAFNTDGTKMFITGSAGVDINEYALTTGFDISTASYSQNFSVISETTSPRGVVFNTDGTKMFVVGQVGSVVYEYDLTTGFDVSTASYSQNFSLSSQETGAQDVAFNSDGTKMFIVGHGGQEVNEYTLSTGFDVSSASYSQNFSVSSQDTIPTGITFNTDGTSMFITGQTNDTVFEYTLTSGFDVSTASYSSKSFSVLSEESSPLGLVFNSNGTKIFITGTNGDEVNEYATTTASTTVKVGQAISATTINMRNLT